MTLPPERISIKRRRQDEPVDTLVLEPGSVHDKKRQFTDFIFQRLKSTNHGFPAAATITTTTTTTTTNNNPVTTTVSDRNAQISTVSGGVSSAGPASAVVESGKSDGDRQIEHESRVDEYSALGVPIVRATKPGDEIGAYPRVKTTVLPTTSPAQVQSASSIVTRRSTPSSTEPRLEQKTKNNAETGHASVHDSNAKAIDGIPLEKIKSARRFHLTRDISSALRPNSSGGIRRRKLNLRPPLATFIERQSGPNAVLPSKKNAPVDSIVHVKGESRATALQENTPMQQPVVDGKTPVKTFQKPASTLTQKDGHSIRDDPSTWDVESDQLADELAALAFEFDPDASMSLEPEEPPALKQKAAMPEPMIVDSDDDYVFETYIRVRRNVNAEDGQAYLGDEFGVLVINDEDHDLWEKYVHEDDDDDDDWDDEDEDSNAEDNPRNDYPEDEVSSDDEYGKNVYKYRRNASDDEQYDNESQW